MASSCITRLHLGRCIVVVGAEWPPVAVRLLSSSGWWLLGGLLLSAGRHRGLCSPRLPAAYQLVQIDIIQVILCIHVAGRMPGLQ